MQAFKRVEQLIDRHADDIVSYLQSIIRIRSVNPVFLDSKPIEEKQCQEFIADTLRDTGFSEIDMWEPDPEDLRRKYLGKPGYTPNRAFENRPNLVARLPGSGGGRSMFLTGHIDVVNANPEEEDWIHDPWGGVVDGGKIYGRGSADMKGGVAAMIQAVRFIHRAGYRLKGDVLVGTVVDEETGSMGMLSLVDRGYRADAGIMTEPTDLRLSVLCRGIIWGRIGVTGRSGHIEVFQPDPSVGGAVDAIDKGCKLLAGLNDLNREWARRKEKRHPLLPRACEINVSMIRAGQHPSSYAENFEATVDIQYLPKERDENGLGGNVKREIEQRLNALAAADPWLKHNPPTFDWFVDADCSEVPITHPLVEICSESLADLGHNAQPLGSEFHTDMSLLTNSSTPTINLGPGDPSIAHLTNEHITIAQLIDCTKIIARVLMQWCGYEEVHA
jgi:acetylornithine deacetylase